MQPSLGHVYNPAARLASLIFTEDASSVAVASVDDLGWVLLNERKSTAENDACKISCLGPSFMNNRYMYLTTREVIIMQHRYLSVESSVQWDTYGGRQVKHPPLLLIFASFEKHFETI